MEFNLTNDDEKIHETNNKKSYSFKSLNRIKENLNITKTKLDRYYQNNNFARMWKKSNYFKSEKNILYSIMNNSNITNACIKALDIYAHYDIMNSLVSHEKKLNNDKIIYFDNASMPGAFIIATHHEFHSKHYNSGKVLDWRASSLVPNDMKLIDIDNKNIINEKPYINEKSNRWLNLNEDYDGYGSDTNSDRNSNVVSNDSTRSDISINVDNTNDDIESKNKYTNHNADSQIPNINTRPLGDKYELYKNYPERWLINNNNNGDVTSVSNLMDFKNQLKCEVDLYTSDLGFDVSDDYNNQESLHYLPNIGQILSGLLLLRKGGWLITKQFTIFNATTVSLLFATSQMFDEFYIYKPLASRSINSEVYIIGKSYKGAIDSYIEAMINILENPEEFKDIPIFKSKIVKKWKNRIVEMSNILANKQKNHIDEKIKQTIKLTKKQHKRNNQNIYCENWKANNNRLYTEWYKKTKILPIIDKDKLKMKV